MARNKKRMSIPGLVPGEDYIIQVRAVDEGEPSTWSERYKVLTIDDTAGGTRTPVTCSLTSFDVNADGVFVAIWPTVNANTDGTALVVNRYEIRLQSALGERIAAHYGASGAEQRRDWSLPQMKALWGGTLPAEITASIRVINSAGTASAEWSNSITASIPIPYPPTAVVPPALPVVDGIKAMWGPPAEPYVAGDRRWPLGYRVYVGTTENFVPDVGGKSNMIYQGPAFETLYTTLSYEVDHWFKVCSYSAADLQSEYISYGPYRPISPYGPDEEPPTIPQNLTATMNADRTVSGQANLTWTMAGDGLPPEAVPPENKDIAGFVVAWRLAGEQIGGQDIWRNTYFGKDERTGVIDLPRAFANYEFKIAAYDFVANYSDFSPVTLLEGAGAAPGPLTGIASVPRWDGAKLLWNHSESQAVINGGRYEIQWRTDNSSFTADTPIEYTTGARELDIAGLNTPLGDYWWRVRARDVMGRTGPWSAVQSLALPPFPTAATSDDIPPAAAPQNVKVTGGLNYLNISWDRVANVDPVTYEVYMSTTNGFTPGAGNFVGSTPATSLMVNSLSAGVPLSQNTTYYVRVVATDADTEQESDKIYSTQQSGQLTQIAGGDLGINMSGENLLYNTSFEEDSDGDGIANYWIMYNNSPGTEPSVASLPSVGRTGGKAQRITWTGTNTSTKGIYCNPTQQVVRPHTEYTLSFYARAGTGTYPGTSAGTGFSIAYNQHPVSNSWIANPTPSATDWKRYIYKFTTGDTVDPSNFFVTIAGHDANGGWVEFDDIQLEAGNIASAYKVGTVSIAKLASGRMETAELVIDRLGIIRSDDYNATTRKGYAITKDGIDLFEGKVNAAILEANSTITNKLFVGSDLEIATGGKFYSTNYRPAGTNGPTDLGAGFRMDSAGFDMRTGTVAFGALSAGTMTTGGLKIGAGGEIVIDSTGAIRSNVYSQGSTGWKISSTGIEMWDTNSKINVAALETGTLSSAIVTIGSGGEIKSSDWRPAGTNGPSDLGAGYRLNQTGLTIYNGTIYGSAVQTNQLKSIKVDPDTGKYAFSLNTDGYAEFSGAWVSGNMRVSNSSDNVIQSGNWNPGGTGWQIRGDGLAQFFQVNTWGMKVYNNATVGNAEHHYIASENYSPGAAGWIIRGNGASEFNGGNMRLGASDGSGGMTWLLNDGGNGQIRFYVPGDMSHYHFLRSVGQEFWINGGWGGYIHFNPNNTIYMASDVHISNSLSAAWITGRGSVSTPVLSASTRVDTPRIHGDPVFAHVGENAQNTHYAIFGREGRLSRGGQNSSERFKQSIEPYRIDPAKVVALEPKTFYYTQDKAEFYGTGQKVGFIAEEAAELGLDFWVSYEEDEETGEMKASGFTYPEFGVAQQVVLRAHQQEIENLKSQVEELKRMVRGS